MFERYLVRVWRNDDSIMSEDFHFDNTLDAENFVRWMLVCNRVEFRSKEIDEKNLIRTVRLIDQDEQDTSKAFIKTWKLKFELSHEVE